ncbi:uncharacterized protein LOC128987386 [Macrosteles quadrilineatus]|uniref:uncharacterized protein LOC128986856 n=1 Tax=Macrosteles quadrilineatus TaxID=74068 RepID=UPI0023E0DFF4|nr:uncharacterized protein LOC128986856 [Macrosteles quadrilineatus]XP_054264185.1 uncharacterized protein LOC128987386 [Macrosteles quadrilineatus]
MNGGQLTLVTAVVILLVFIYTYGPTQAQQVDKRTFKKTFVEAAKKCSQEVGPPSAMSVAFLTSPEQTDQKSKCFTSCLLHKFNLMDRQGKFSQSSMQKFLNSIPESRFKESISRNSATCMKENAKDVCEKGYRFVQCFYKKG